MSPDTAGARASQETVHPPPPSGASVTVATAAPQQAASTSPTDFTWMIGGPQGSGVESGANIFSQICAEAGYRIFGKREFYSNIKGEHSYFTVRVADRDIHSNTSGVNLLASFDAETIFRHYDEVLPGGGIIYDAELEEIGTDRVHTMDERFKKRLHERLDGRGAEHTVAGALRCARDAGANLYPVSFKYILDRLAREEDNPKLRGFVRMYNTISVALSLALVRMPTEPLLGSIDKIFAKKPAVARLNKHVAELSHEEDVLGDIGSFGHVLGGAPKEPHTILVQGHQGTALGKMACGCRFQSYYPITPASDESVYMETHEILDIIDDRPGSTTVVQTEDEICAIGMAIGGTLTGTRSSTCTSGPGFSLMNEALGWAGINEVPIVITDYQRSGPSTGLPTRHGQDDLLSVIFAGHGEFPRIVYASGSVEESFYDTGRCFNYADEFQVPLIHMMDKFLASSVVTCKRFEPQKIAINRGKLLESIQPQGNGSGNGAYRRFEFSDDGISPRSRLGMDNGIFWNTGDESDETGHITEDPVLRVMMMEKRMSRLDVILDRIPAEEQAVARDTDGSDIIVVTWGSATGPITDAVDMLREEDGTRIGLIQVKLLHPFPARLIAELLSMPHREGGAHPGGALEGDGSGKDKGGSSSGRRAKVLVDIESNYTGQLGVLLAQHLRRHPDHYVLKYSGRGMTCTEVRDALRRIVDGSAKKREVLTHGA